jgi:predicted nucleic acid-binding protein
MSSKTIQSGSPGRKESWTQRVPPTRSRLIPSSTQKLSIAFNRIEELEAVIAEASLAVEPIPREALFLAGKVFLSYRRGRGTKQSVLPNFYIGAHAAVMQWPILTRDVGRFRSYFPTVQLITP